MSSFSLKIIAVVTMVIDHIGYLFFPEQLIFRTIGRIAFPLFAFLLAEGFNKTRNRYEYLKRLVLFASIAQIPFTIFHMQTGTSLIALNILFTFACGLIILSILDSRLGWLKKAILILPIVLFNELIHFEYGLYGLLTIVLCSMFLRKRTWGLVLLCLLPIFYWGSLTTVYIFSLQVFAVFAVIPMLLYNGALGLKVPRLWFYWFYPVHLAVLSVIYALVG